MTDREREVSVPDSPMFEVAGEITQHEHQNRHDPFTRRVPGCPFCARWKHPAEGIDYAHGKPDIRYSLNLDAGLHLLLIAYTDATGEDPNAVVNEALRSWLAQRGDIIRGQR